MTLDKLRFRLKSVVASRADVGSFLKEVGDAVLVQRERPRLLIMTCPDGCGAEVIVNLDNRAGPAWSIYQTGLGFSLYPSVWRDSGCGSHYIVWNDTIYMFRTDGDDWFKEDNPRLLLRVLDSLIASGTEQRYQDIAIQLVEIPWGVLAACHALVRQGKARYGQERGSFIAESGQQKTTNV